MLGSDLAPKAAGLQKSPQAFLNWIFRGTALQILYLESESPIIIVNSILLGPIHAYIKIWSLLQLPRLGKW